MFDENRFSDNELRRIRAESMLEFQLGRKPTLREIRDGMEELKKYDSKSHDGVSFEEVHQINNVRDIDDYDTLTNQKLRHSSGEQLRYHNREHFAENPEKMRTYLRKKTTAKPQLKQQTDPINKIANTALKLTTAGVIMGVGLGVMGGLAGALRKKGKKSTSRVKRNKKCRCK